jgi:hypothetical protein
MQVHLKRFALITSFFVRMGNFDTDLPTTINHQPSTNNQQLLIQINFKSSPDGRENPELFSEDLE